MLGLNPEDTKEILAAIIIAVIFVVPITSTIVITSIGYWRNEIEKTRGRNKNVK